MIFGDMPQCESDYLIVTPQSPSPACKWEMTGRRAERDPRWSPTLAAFRWLGLTLPI
jgi:hypothetical protein